MEKLLEWSRVNQLLCIKPGNPNPVLLPLYLMTNAGHSGEEAEALMLVKHIALKIVHSG